MKFHKKTSMLVISSLILSILIGGCTPARKPVVPNPTPNPAPNVPPAVNRERDSDTIDQYENNTPMNPNTTPVNPNTTTMDRNRKMENDVENGINKITGVSNATVLINNNTAYVGVDLAANIESAKTNAKKDEIIKKVKDMEPAINTVYVSTDVDVVGRFRNYARDVRNGKPISGFIDEIEEMFRRPVPRS
ncbi:YhcN/YlaJ family sporulation lipoprotein [Inediibacterium massiliense]|uniref:YhcN/YlaJ family sporulation lipoprotein n=1 Tax=Inediibacterium massiliense TaxID=1658111 RepID=UPI0006B45238|nr:YhcN/YlaJ family sporulation lipoprotein [Inediibacterium massiliense]